MRIFAIPLTPEAKARAIAAIVARCEAAELAPAPIPAPPSRPAPAKPTKRRKARKGDKPRSLSRAQRAKYAADKRRAYAIRAEREAANPELKAARLARRREKDRAKRLEQGFTFREAGTIEGRERAAANPEIKRDRERAKRRRYYAKNRDRINHSRREKYAAKQGG